MNRQEMLAATRQLYVRNRLNNIEPEFLEYEEEMIADQDLETLLTLPRSSQLNPHNSAILYVTGITDEYDRLKHVDTIGGSYCDIDMDFDALDIHKIVDWTIDHYGRECVANILALQKFKPRSTVRKYFMVTTPKRKDFETDEAHLKALGEHDKTCAEILSKIPEALFGKEPTLAEAVNGDEHKGWKGSPELATNPRYAGWYKVASKLEGMISAFSIHAAGVVVSNAPISDVIPVWYRSGKDEAGEVADRWITQFTMEEVEAHGLLKFDFLRTDSLSIIKECLRYIKVRHGIDIDPYSLEDGNELAYKIISSGNTTGLFQLEASKSAKTLGQKIKPCDFNELSDLSAANRPGPIQAGLVAKYVYNKQNNIRRPPELPDVFADILEPTFGVMLYQEQLMAIVSKIASFTLKEADNVRKAVGKKDLPKLKPWREVFIKGCIASGIPEAYATEFWVDTIIGCADYLFNKSHSILYGYQTYICAWLKANYTVEFFAALMSVRSQTLAPDKWAIKAPDYVREARAFGISIHFPDVNRSHTGFIIENNAIYFGFSSIRKVGANASKKILEARAAGPFIDVIDFLQRVDRQKINIGVFNQLVVAGGFDRMGYSRKELLARSQELYDHLKNKIEQQERALQNIAREEENIEIAALIKTRDEIRARCKKKGYEPTAEETEFLAVKAKRLMLHRPLAITPATVIEPFTRSKKLTLHISDIFAQGQAVGCFIVHPATIIYPETTRISQLRGVDTYELAGIVTDVKTWRNSNGSSTYVTIADGTGSIRYRTTDKNAPSVDQLIKIKVRGGYPDDADDDQDPKIYSVYNTVVFGE